jgi:hypothetical protein
MALARTRPKLDKSLIFVHDLFEMITPPAPETNDQTDWARPLFERQVALLGRMAEAGLTITLAIEGEAKAPEPVAKDPRLYVAYARVARAVRLSLMLQTKVIKQLQAIDSQAATQEACAAAHERVQRAEHVEEQKARVERIVERIAQRGDGLDVERLVEETAERLDHDDLYGGVLDRPLSELIALICRDLGLAPDWPRLAEEAWAQEEMAGGTTGWPLADVATTEPWVSSAPPLRPSS